MNRHWQPCGSDRSRYARKEARADQKELTKGTDIADWWLLERVEMGERDQGKAKECPNGRIQ